MPYEHFNRAKSHCDCNDGRASNVSTQANMILVKLVDFLRILKGRHRNHLINARQDAYDSQGLRVIQGIAPLPLSNQMVHLEFAAKPMGEKSIVSISVCRASEKLVLGGV